MLGCALMTLSGPPTSGQTRLSNTTWCRAKAPTAARRHATPALQEGSEQDLNAYVALFTLGTDSLHQVKALFDFLRTFRTNFALRRSLPHLEVAPSSHYKAPELKAAYSLSRLSYHFSIWPQQSLETCGSHPHRLIIQANTSNSTQDQRHPVNV